jgi:cell division protease FtsH
VRIDHEVSRIVQTGYERATSILSQYREVLDRVARELLERETLDGEEVYQMIRDLTGREPAPPRPVPPGEGLVVGGHDVPEAVVSGHRAGGAEAAKPEAKEEVEPVEPEVAGAKRRAAQPVPEPGETA